jgi:hypothetical protein
MDVMEVKMKYGLNVDEDDMKSLRKYKNVKRVEKKKGDKVVVL